MKKVLATLLVLVTFAVAASFPNVFDGHGEDMMFSASTVYASAEGQFAHEHLHSALEECGKKKSRWSYCFECNGFGQCQNCGGKGRFVIYDPNGFPIYQNCWRCNGSGLCEICGGRGGYYIPY